MLVPAVFIVTGLVTFQSDQWFRLIKILHPPLPLKVYHYAKLQRK